MISFFVIVSSVPSAHNVSVLPPEFCTIMLNKIRFVGWLKQSSLKLNKLQLKLSLGDFLKIGGTGKTYRFI
jgi:hypothetical protein